VSPLLKETLRLQEKSSRKAKIEDVLLKQYSEKDPFGLAVLHIKFPQKAKFLSVLVKNSGAVVGGALKPADKAGVSVSFIRGGPGPISVDVGVIDASGGTISSAINVPVRGRTVKLIELPALEDFTGAIRSSAQRYLGAATVQGPASGGFVSVRIGGYCTSAAMAAARGKADSADAALEAVSSVADMPSASLARRLQLAAFLGGARRVLDNQGLVRADYEELGMPYTPIALFADDGADTRSNPLFKHVFGAPGELGLEQDVLTAGPYGEIFDVINEFHPSSKYAVVWMTAKRDLARHERQALTDYVKQGGILVLHPYAARQLSSNLVGAEFTGRTKSAEQIETPVASSSTIQVPYSYQEMECGSNSQILAWTEMGDPVMSWRKAGKGIVIVMANETTSDYAGNLLPVVPSLLQILSEQLLPIQPPPDMQSFINRTRDGWIIGMINNHGVTKGPFSPATVDPREARDVVLKFQKSNPLHFDAMLGEFAWDNFSNGLVTTIPPGETAIVKLKMP
jgi:hypothetical protein